LNKTIVLLFILASTVCLSHAQSYSDLISEAYKLYQAEEYEQSKVKYEQAFLLDDKNADDSYNGACSAALAGDAKSAISMLESSVRNGWSNPNWLQEDEDLKSLHERDKWDAIVAKATKNLEEIEAKYNKPLRADLLKIYDDDQIVRRVVMKMAKEFGWDNPKLDSIKQVMSHLDSVNTIKVVNIINDYGWVAKELVGERGNTAIFLVIQHADLDIQVKYLPMMRIAVKEGNARPQSLALLEDRVALGQGKRQIYGSQIKRDSLTNQFYVAPMIDPDNVDQRRAEVGLRTIAEYVIGFGVIWDVDKHKERIAKNEN